MSRSRLSRIAFVFALLFALPVLAAEPQVEFFSPSGTIKSVRQAVARFSVPMVPFGDPRLDEPFDITCPVAGKGRWADARNWVYDFDRDLPAGVVCTFRLKAESKSLAGEALTGAREFSFNTGGPAIRQSLPYQGSWIDEEQIFILGLDAPATTASVLEHAWCEIAGVHEKVGVRLLGADERKQLLDQKRDLFDRMIRAFVIRKNDGAVVGALDTRDLLKGSDLERMIVNPENSPIAVLACKRRLPNDAEVRLIWGSGIATPSGIATTTDQTLPWRVRSAFRASFHCDRVNPQAQCMPMLPMTLQLSAPVARELAAKIELKGADGKRYRAQLDENETSVSNVAFAGPFPEKAEFTVILPRPFVDDAKRPLANGDMYPLKVRTDEYPPLAKFPSRFGIVELNADATLPITVRNLDAADGDASGVIAKLRTAWGSLIGYEKAPLDLQVLRAEGGEAEIIQWLRQLREHESEEGSRSIFADAARKPQPMQVPRAEESRAFEVVGIPLKKPGFYVLELASPRLGAALLRDPENLEDPIGPYYVQSAALVTNLAVHLKLGRESSLVWVTTLDQGKPAAGTAVEVRDCDGKVYWKGVTDASGVARVNEELPPLDELPGCFNSWDRQYFVTARRGNDLSFVLSRWDDGIDPWRFHLPMGRYDGPDVATSVFDRSLFRAGETVHMTHFYRRHTGTGFAFIDKERLPDKLRIEHLGSEENYEQPLVWDESGVAQSEWTIPADAKLGSYQVQFRYGEGKTARRRAQRVGGTFRVEAFRVPTMKAFLKPVEAPLVNVSSAAMDAQLNYFSGGGASDAAVKLRGLVESYTPSFAGYDGFTFANGNVREGRDRDAAQPWYLGDYELGGDEEEGGDGEGASTQANGAKVLATRSVTLDRAGAARVTFDNLPKAETPQVIQAEMEYNDANGEILTTSTRIPLWPANLVIGLKPDAWAASKEKVRFHALALGLDGKPRAGVAIKLDLLQRTSFSHRKRLIGGFYAYESHSEVKRLQDACAGNTDAKGLLICEFKSPVAGNIIVRAKASDEAGNAAYANRDVWVAGKEDWWFDVSNDDRMDLLPEKPRYEPDETAVFQVRMPFREATALVTVEREGVSESFVTQLSGKEPVVRVPLKGHYAPNVFVSVLAVRGRVAGVQPTALIDLGKPAFKLGIAKIRVGWKAHELNVQVAADSEVYPVRGKAAVKVSVRNPDGTPTRNGEVEFAAVDEGLLELLPNSSWDLLDAMMKERGIEVTTATAQMQVIGRRHYGRKAVAAGGGGGQQNARELFDTLLLWRGRVRLDDHGEATVEVPINDSLTAFRLVAVAHAGVGLFGTGKATIRTSQDLILLSGLPPQLREQDRFVAMVTARNTSSKPLDVKIDANWQVVERAGSVATESGALAPVQLTLQPGQAAPVAWEASAPINARRIEWRFTAQSEGAQDQLKITQKVIPAVAVRTFQATLAQLDQPFTLPVAIPADAIPGRGGIQIHLRAKLADELAGVKEYMGDYPYSCLEQKVSQAIALGDEARWEAVVNALPAYLDRDGLAKYFPLMRQGSDTLTAYLLIIANEAGWEIPDGPRERMVRGLQRFVAGSVVRYSALPTADLTLRKLSALNALARYQGGVGPESLGSITIDPNLWPTSGVLDWLDILDRSRALAEREERTREAEQILRARLNFQGTIMNFSTERSDALWWLMCSADTNANRALISLLERDGWREDLPRMVRGSVGRQHRGHWGTTVANAWGAIALAKFSQKFEAESVAGTTRASLASATRDHDWSAHAAGGTLALPWPGGGDTLAVNHDGSGKPWVTVQSLAAIPLKEPFSSGYRVTRTITPVEQKVKGQWSRGDLYRVRLDLEAQSDMTWVVVRDPIPSGASVLGTGLGNDAQLLTRGEKRQGWVWPAFEERAADSFRAYYEFVPKGKWTVEYTARLNNAGSFQLPETRVEAMYSPEAFAEIPNRGMEVAP